LPVLGGWPATRAADPIGETRGSQVITPKVKVEEARHRQAHAELKLGQVTTV
jgi:hypothetical protein